MIKNIPCVTIVILNYNGASDTIDCLNSLLKISYVNYKIVIIDNASTDDSVSILLTYLKKSGKSLCCMDALDNCSLNNFDNISFFTFIKSTINGGYGHGNNIGISYGLKRGSDYILVLNNDTEVAPDFLEPLVIEAENNPRLGIVSGKMYFYDRPDTLWFNGGYLNPCSSKIEHVSFNQKDIGQATLRSSTFITGCMWLIPSRVFSQIGLINEDYFMYVEDVEFCKRVMLANFELLVTPESKIFHKVGGSTGGMLSEFSVFWRVRNMHKFIYKNVEKKHCRFLSYLRFNAIYLYKIIFSMKFPLLLVYIKSLISLRKG